MAAAMESCWLTQSLNRSLRVKGFKTFKSLKFKKEEYIIKDSSRKQGLPCWLSLFFSGNPFCMFKLGCIKMRAGTTEVVGRTATTCNSG